MQCRPFFERWLARLPMHYSVASVLVGLPLVLGHAALRILHRADVLNDYSWMVGGIVAYILFLVTWATTRLRTLVVDIYGVFGLDSGNMRYVDILAHTLRTRTLLGYGLAFGALNLLFGLTFGIWYSDTVLALSLALQFVTVGAVAGFAVCGLVGVTRLIKTLERESPITLNVLAPDLCADTSRIGRTMLHYSLVSLSAGVLIGLYIYLSPWTHRTHATVRLSIYAWMAFPHIAAVTVLLAPTIRLHRIIRSFKSSMTKTLMERSAHLSGRIYTMTTDDSLTTLQALLAASHEYTQTGQIYAHVDRLRTWPYNLASGASFLLSYLLSLLVPVATLVQMLSSRQSSP